MVRKNKKVKISANNLFSFAPSKSQEQKIRIIEAAIKSYALKGLEKTTYTYLAEVCQVSRPLIHHYFPSLDELFLLTAKYVRQTLLQMAVDELNKAPKDEPMLQIQGYVKGCFRWVREQPHQCSFWFLYFYQASRLHQAREENTQMVAAGHQRIQSILESGNQKKIWNFFDLNKAAKLIQVLVTGGMVSAMSEDGFFNSITGEKMIIAFIEDYATKSLIHR